MDNSALESFIDFCDNMEIVEEGLLNMFSKDAKIGKKFYRIIDRSTPYLYPTAQDKCYNELQKELKAYPNILIPSNAIEIINECKAKYVKEMQKLIKEYPMCDPANIKDPASFRVKTIDAKRDEKIYEKYKDLTKETSAFNVKVALIINNGVSKEKLNFDTKDMIPCDVKELIDALKLTPEEKEIINVIDKIDDMTIGMDGDDCDPILDKFEDQLKLYFPDLDVDEDPGVFDTYRNSKIPVVTYMFYIQEVRSAMHSFERIISKLHRSFANVLKIAKYT